jgi:hypothetical protein
MSVIIEVDVFCICVKKAKRKETKRREIEENGKKMLTGRVMIVFLCLAVFFCRCDSNQLILYEEEEEKEKEINQYDAFSLLSIKQSMFSSRSLSSFLVLLLVVYVYF